MFARNTGYSFADPFQDYRMHWDHPDRGYLSEEEIQAIMSKKITIKRIERVRDIFIFSCFTGLAYIDIMELSDKDIQTGIDSRPWIITERHKTKKDIKVPLLEIPLSIKKKYENKVIDGKLLPDISNQRVNSYLKEIADLCDINKNLTFHTARPAFGYSACPDHSLKKDVFDLLDAPAKIGVSLTSAYAINPTTSLCVMQIAHPEARYFSIGKIGDDQLVDYCQKRGITEEEGRKITGI